MDIDYACAWLELKGVVLSRGSHGSRQLLAEMARLEVENRVPEGQEGFSDLPAQHAKGRSRSATDQPAGLTGMAEHASPLTQEARDGSRTAGSSRTHQSVA